MSFGFFFVGRSSVVPFVFAVVMFPVNVGCVRAWVFASNPEASRMSVGSLNAVPRKLMPIGIPRTFAAGTCTIGLPGPHAQPELAQREWSERIRHGVHTELAVGATHDSRLIVLRAASIPLTPELRSI